MPNTLPGHIDPKADPQADPKGAAGKLKCPLQLLPSAPQQQTAWVFRHGADKYGEYNWRKNNVIASTYMGAMRRHLEAWYSGEDEDEESGKDHLAHVIASAMILMDAKSHGTLIDDRP